MKDFLIIYGIISIAILSFCIGWQRGYSKGYKSKIPAPIYVGIYKDRLDDKEIQKAFYINSTDQHRSWK